MGEEGAALTLTGLKRDGVTVVIIAHRPSILAGVDQILALRPDGTVRRSADLVGTSKMGDDDDGDLVSTHEQVSGWSSASSTRLVISAARFYDNAT